MARAKGSTVRRKGFNAEREYARLFRELGFPLCKTSRYGSKLHDDAGIDLINLPLNVQIKAGRQQGLHIPNLIAELKLRIKSMFPRTALEQTNLMVIIHHRDGKRGIPRAETDSIVSMTFTDFCKLIERVKWD